MNADAVPADWSEITPAWMTAALARDLPGTEVATVEVVSRDDGTNRRARLGLTYRTGTGPDVVFVKGEGAWRESHARNGNMFNEPLLFASRLDLPVDHPHPYHAAIDRPAQDYVIVMEDLTRRGADPRDATRPMTVAQVEHGVRQLARLHSAYWDLDPNHPGLEWLQPWAPTAGWKASLGPGLAVGRARVPELLPAELRGRTDDELLDWCMRSMATFGQEHHTLLHADPHIGNTYVLPGDRVGFLDWQVCRRGNWAQDLAYFLVSALTIEDRRESEEGLLNAYLDALEVPAEGRPTIDDVRLRVAAAHPYSLVVWLTTHQSDRAQRPEVCRALIAAYGAAMADSRSADALDRLGA